MALVAVSGSRDVQRCIVLGMGFLFGRGVKGNMMLALFRVVLVTGRQGGLGRVGRLMGWLFGGLGGGVAQIELRSCNVSACRDGSRVVTVFDVAIAVIFGSEEPRCWISVSIASVGRTNTTYQLSGDAS